MYKFFSSYKLMVLLLLALAVGASIATFIENDFGTFKARELVYDSLWYEAILALASLNLLAIIHKTKMYRLKAKFLFHTALIVIVVGAGVTRYFGAEGIMNIREGNTSNTFIYKNKEIKLPFSLQLVDFEMKRYPGSRSPSSFSSDVVVIDGDKKFEYKIYMNHPLTYKGYKFFQTSYDTDELGTILSVNKDPGKEITYIGYGLLFLGLILNLFDKNSRFQRLIGRIKKMQIASFLLVLLTTCSQNLEASAYMQEYLNEHQKNSYELSEEFGKLVVQARMGRMKTLDSLNREILSKLTRKSEFLGMSANQIVLGMFTRPALWQNVPIIKIKTPKLKKLLKLKKDVKFAKVSDFFYENRNYKIARFVEEANRLVPSKRGTFERDVIAVDERVNVALMVFRGSLLKIFPVKNDKNNKWADFKKMFMSFDDENLKLSTQRFLDEVFNRNYKKAMPYLDTIKAYQQNYGKKVLPSQTKLKAEIFYNKANIFTNLSWIYMLLGVFLFIYSIMTLFSNRLISKKVKNSIVFIIIILFLIQSFGILLRWYISGYIPLSNTYETMIYISFSALLMALVFFRNSIIALSSAVMIAGIFMFGAYLGGADPEITNLVPVLKSFWLSVHVSVITASYGFLGVGAMIGFIVLILFSLRSSKRIYIDKHIKNLTDINEVTLILGLTLLVIGNFLGGIWANESWGRYWGWDPKETWAYIAIIIYTLVTHLRLMREFYSIYLFNALSLLSFSTILMTYFGVNFYLAGKHSYATGDPVPIPTWVYILGFIVTLLIVLSYKKRNLKEHI